MKKEIHQEKGGPIYFRETYLSDRLKEAEDLLRDWLRGGECFCSDHTANRGPCEFCKTMEYFQEKTPYPPATAPSPANKRTKGFMTIQERLIELLNASRDDDDRWIDGNGDYLSEKDVAFLTPKAVEVTEITDTQRLEWLLDLIDREGTDGIAGIQWTMLTEDAEDSDFALDRAAIDAAIKKELGL